MAEPTPATLPEVIVTPVRPGVFHIFNPFVRTHVLGDDAFVALLGELAGDGGGGAPAERAIRAVDATVSPFRDGLLGDPTGLDRDATLDGAPALDVAAAIELARKRQLVADDPKAYAASIGPRRNVLDRKRIGNIHQQVGEHVLLELRRRSVDEWWVDQKFTADRRGPREGPYRWVQGTFMDAVYDRDDLAEHTVLDFGCGPGLFTRLFASRGARVVGVDTNPDHLETARALCAEDGLTERVELHELALPVDEGLAALGDRRFDLIFLSDVLMFYFYSYDTRVELDPVALLRTLAGLLAAGGRIAVLEPHGTFWQHPWLGAPERPFTIVTEHRHRRTGVTPTLEELSRAAEAAGLGIVRARELVADDPAPGDRAQGFAAEFPLWWFLELGRVEGTG
jgi:SAM-dependent methyltransferase